MDSTNSDKKLILTQDEADFIKAKVEDLRLALYKTHFDAEKFIDNNFTESQKNYVLSEIKITSKANEMEKSIDKLLKNITDMDLMTVKIAFEPTVSFTTWLKEFLSENIADKGNLIIKIDSDKSILAGVLLEFKGKIKDQSAKAEILNILSSNK